MHKKFEINLTNIKGGCQSGRKVVAHNSKSDLPLLLLLKQTLKKKVNKRKKTKGAGGGEPNPNKSILAIDTPFLQ